MSFLNSLNINGSALTATKLRMDIISENIANSQSTRTENGGPYRRKLVEYETIENNDFRSAFERGLNNLKTGGVRVSRVIEDDTPFTPVYKPEHPDADENGYVLMPNVDVVRETIDMMAATRAYDANITAFNAVKSMAVKALEIGR